MQFDKTADGYTPGFEDPYWTSQCRGYRIAKMRVMQVHSFRLLKAYKAANGYPWIGAGTGGYNTKQAAILAANVYHLAMRRKNYVVEQVVATMVQRLGATREQLLEVLLAIDPTARTHEELLT